ncbi:hypothetical protein [Niabella ginsengisoli]|uniref:ABC transporter ATPase n=1 Tax=Niabella ginsengisoli TaxID=522298 RepID=A0ABS9SQY7_9BACT|nr:hypothetical protein [Niabella ginsengisoli]MCH5600813.1 hypothetical protein [Niabella ginsengisoli]
MNLNYKELLPADFDPASRVWIYQASRLLSMGEALDAEQKINDFAVQWQSHGADVKATGFLFFGQFVILIADETHAGVSGCSTDSSVRFIKVLESAYGISFFDRTSLAFFVKDKIQLIPYAQLQYALDNGFITADTLYFNNLVANKAELENKWIIPLKESWLKDRVQILV